MTGRRQGTFIFYSAADEYVRRLLAQALRHADHIDPEPPEVLSRRTGGEEA